MSSEDLFVGDPFERQQLDVLDSDIAYVDVGEGESILFLHGNPTSSYLWRNILPHVENTARCLAPDLIGMGDSGKNPSGSYRYIDHREYLFAWLDRLDLEDVLLVVHDWGSVLGFDWARNNPDRVRGVAYMEAILPPLTWDEFPDDMEDVFRSLRSEKGEEMVLENNFFVEKILPNSILRDLSEAEMDHYREPYREPGESRRPTLTWPREVPIDGEPGDTDRIIRDCADWLEESDLPKLFVNPDPGILTQGAREEFCRSLSNQEELSVRGLHFVQEDAPQQIGRALLEFHSDVTGS